MSPMFFDAKYMRFQLKFHICNIRFKCFRFYVRHFYFRLNWHRIVHQAFSLSAAVTSASSKTNAATLNLLLKLIYALQFNGHQVSHFHQKIIHTISRWFTSITAWTISKMSTSCHRVLMALGIRRSAIEKFDGQLRYSRKPTGVALHPRYSRVNLQVKPTPKLYGLANRTVEYSNKMDHVTLHHVYQIFLKIKCATNNN